MQTKTQRFCRVDWLIIDPKRKPWWLLYMRASGVRPSSLCCRSMTLSYRLPWVSDRCKGLSFFFFFCEFHQGHWTGYCALWSNRAVPCWPRWHLLFVSAPLLTSTSYCHVVSWGSCQGEQSPSSLTTTGLITWTICTPRSITGKLFPREVFIAIVAAINLNTTNTFKRGFII